MIALLALFALVLIPLGLPPIGALAMFTFWIVLYFGGLWLL